MSLAQVENVDSGSRVSANADPAIKLFGRDIPLTTFESSPSAEEPCSHLDAPCEAPHFDEEEQQMKFALNEVGSSSGSNDGWEEVGNQKGTGGTHSFVGPPPCIENSKVKAEDAQIFVSLDKVSKRPDKLIPCPRCESLDTKFCYFNNYNVNQPRHFCRKCQRYWTAGGTLRNVPIGAGRRKNKHSASHKKPAASPDTIRVRSDPSDMARSSAALSTTSSIPSNQLNLGQQPRLHVPSIDVCATPALDSPCSPSAIGALRSFGQESPLCKSMAATTLTMQKCAPMQSFRRFNGESIAPGHVKVELENTISSEHEVNAASRVSNTNNKNDAPTALPTVEVVSLDKSASISTITTHSVSSGMVSQQGEHGGDPSSSECEKLTQGTCGFSPYSGLWQLGTNPAWNNPSNVGGAPNLDGALALLPPSMFACNGASPPGGLWASLPWHIMYPPAMWGSHFDGGGSWAMPWGPAAAAGAVMQSSGLANTVRKHQLDGEQPEGCIWVPKTLRIDDPVDAARSSIWATLGLGDGPVSSPLEGVTKAFQTKSETKDVDESTTPKRHTNPAAHSRSVAFNESS